MTKDEVLQLKPGTIIGTVLPVNDDIIIIDFYEDGIIADDGFYGFRKISYVVLGEDIVRSTIFVSEI